MNTKRYFKGALVVFFILTAGLCALLFGVWKHLPTWLLGVPAVLLLVFGGAFKWLAKTEAERPQRFVSAFMGSLSLKMFLVLAVVGGYIYLDGPHYVWVSLLILACYAGFLVHFTAIASAELRSQGKK